ncbi:MAG: EI24 domain-containing protein [Myxococcota bacterium]
MGRDPRLRASGAQGSLGALESLRTALALLRSERGLWGVAALPALINLAMFLVAVAVFLQHLDTLSALTGAWLSPGAPESWYGWLWVGPLRALAWAARGLLLLLFGVALYFGFTLLGGVVASPFLDRLSAKVERIYFGAVPEIEVGMLRSALRAVVDETRRTLFFLGVQAGFLLLGWIPGLQPLALAGALAFTVLFLPLEYTGYVMDRRGLPFRARRRWIWQQRRRMIPFGAAAFATFFVPGLNFLCLPWLVTAATLLSGDVD